MVYSLRVTGWSKVEPHVAHHSAALISSRKLPTMPTPTVVPQQGYFPRKVEWGERAGMVRWPGYALRACIEDLSTPVGLLRAYRRTCNEAVLL